jgi:pyridoxal 5-phosphate dependent beta-lyase
VADEWDPLWRRWHERRAPTRGIHLDCAAAGRTSSATISAVAVHMRLEAELGAYVAQSAAAETLTGLRSDLAALFGLPRDGVALVESASAALRALLSCWPLPKGAAVAVAPSEWGPNLAAFAAAGMQVVLLDADEHGVVDIDRLQHRMITNPPALVHITQVAAHRGLVQPVATIARACREAGIPLWIDAAQAVGHVDTAIGPDAVYATGRKWLCGPRGVGFLGISERWWSSLQVQHHVLAASDEPTVLAMESDDANVAGRIGLAVAVGELLDDTPAAAYRRLDEVGAATRAALDGLPGWTVEPANGSAITALRPTAGQDVAAVRDVLLVEHGILTTASMPARAPHDLAEPLLRISPHVDCSAEQREALRHALYTNG